MIVHIAKASWVEHRFVDTLTQGSYAISLERVHELTFTNVVPGFFEIYLYLLD